MSKYNPDDFSRADREARFETEDLTKNIVKTTKLLIIDMDDESISQILDNQVVIMNALSKLLYKQVFDEELKNSK